MNRICIRIPAALTLLAGCEGGPPESPVAPVVRDSAGVTIVENSAPRYTGAAAWRVAADPVLSVGGLTGDPSEELYRVSGAVRLGDGRIVIANAGSSELRLFDAAGAYLRAAGSRGGGPGEFQTISSLRRYGTDSLAVLDGEQRRVTVYDLEANLGRTTTLIPGEAGGMPFLGATFAVFGDGTFFLSTLDMFSARPEDGAMRGTEPLFRISETGALLDTLGAFPGREMFIQTGERGVRATVRIFGRSSYYAAAAGHFFVGTNDRYEISRFSPAGSLQMLIRVRHDQTPVERHHRETFMETRLADLDAQARIEYRERYAGNEPPPVFPAYADLITDRDGNLWVGNYLAPDERDRRFSVFDSNGHWVTDVDTPLGLTALEIGTDYVLGLWRDELDVEHVRLFTLVRS